MVAFRMLEIINILILLILIPQQYSFCMYGQRTFSTTYHNENRATEDSLLNKSQFVSVVFWNVENLYDPFDDSLTNDEEFTPAGTKHWTWNKFRRKTDQLAKTLGVVAGWALPDLIGLCEVENRMVLHQLIRHGVLRTGQYQIVHHESPDRRGVDVAFLYRPDRFTVLADKVLTIRFPFDTSARTRDILMVKGLVHGRDTLHLFVNHWPSRRGGQQSSAPRRNYVGTLLRKSADSLFRHDSTANIVIMGDLNDDPEDLSVLTHLGAKNSVADLHAGALYNLMGIRNRTRPEGTLKFRDQWSTFDQFIVSGAMLMGKAGLITAPDHAFVCMATFLVEEDLQFFGVKLKRTYAGPKYLGGFSDHLPILLKIIIAKTEASH